MDCNTCKNKDVPYITHEGILARMERTITKLWVLIILLIVLLVGSNIAWLVYENSFEEVTTEIEQRADGDSSNYIVGGDFNGGNAED